MNHGALVIGDDQITSRFKKIVEQYYVVDLCKSLSEATQYVNDSIYHVIVCAEGKEEEKFTEFLKHLKVNHQGVVIFMVTPDQAKSSQVIELEEMMIEKIGSSNQEIESFTQKIKQLVKFSALVKKTAKQTEKDFLSIVSHDLKSPLGFIHATADVMLQEKQNLNDTDTEICYRVKNAANYCLTLVSDLLEVEKLDYSDFTLDLEEFEISGLIASVLQMQRFEIEKNKIKIKVSEKEKDIVVFADYGRIFQLVANLISNAIKYSPSETEILIALKKGKSDSVGGISSNLLIEVKDQGRGVPLEKQKTIFNKYVQVKSEDRMIGTGLGLSICDRISQLHRGKIWVESNGVNQGSTFIASLPIIPIPKEKSKVETILVCDDSSDIRMLLEEDLSELGYQVELAVNGKDCLEKLQEKNIDLILMDLNMPILGGLETLAKLRKMKSKVSSIPVIMMTNDVEPKILKKIGQYASDFIYKPAEQEELSDLISKYDGELKEELVKEALEEKKSILVVDDELEIRTILKESIMAEGYQIITAKNGFEALFMNKKYQPSLIVTDIRMPGMNGIELAYHLKRLKNAAPILFISANIEEIPKDVYRGLSRFECLSKPFDFGELNQKVKGLLKESQKTQRNLRILLIDDSKDISLLMRRILKNKAIEFYEAHHSSQAYDLLKRNEFDLVILDYQLKDESGLEVLKELKKRMTDKDNGPLPIVAAFTSSKDKQDEMLENGCDTFISKPIKAKTLYDEIVSIVDSKQKAA